MTREEAKQIALDAINKEIDTHGENHVYLLTPQRGKNSWTLKEAKESIIEDKCLENTSTNLIDGIINLDTYMKKNKQKNGKRNNI